MRRLCLAVACGLVLALVNEGSQEAVSAPPGQTYSAIVFATSPDWFNTGIFLQPGDVVRITSDLSDTWCWGDPIFGGDTCPNGNGALDRPNEEERPTTLFPDGHFGQLYARIGAQIIPGGTDTSATASSAGSLELIMNERLGTHGDNSGSITFTVHVQPQPGVSQPPMSDSALKLPWTAGETWYYTGGPHCDEAAPQANCPTRAVRYAVDFAPEAFGIPCPAPSESHPEIRSERWVVAAADGKVVRARDSVVEIQHANGSRTGYMHLSDIQVTVGGPPVVAGQPLGHPSCAIPAGGRTTGVHLHFYFKQGNSKVPADGQLVSGWTIHESSLNYNGTMTRPGEVLTATTGRTGNGLVSDNVP